MNQELESISREKQSFIDMLQAQILVYREDFESERHDRERAQGKLMELKTELEYLKKRLVRIVPSTLTLNECKFSKNSSLQLSAFVVNIF